ncbi:MAG TPA: hypothetical protein VGO68_21725 [Pyrinomonadaceae bacterium]|jgi:hypothetical protein|nr:hypothetical protein [Pyrinomonadaceae bacterium]
MSESSQESQAHTVLGQKYAYATVSLVLGLACFVNLAGLEKAILAVIFGWLALKSAPAPALKTRRVWAQTGVVLGGLVLVVVPIIIILNFDRLRIILETLMKLSNGK